MVKILAVTRAVHINSAVERGLGGSHDVEIYDGSSRGELCRRIGDAEIAIVSGMGLPQKFLDEGVLACAPKLKLIQQFGVGKEVMDLAAAHARGIWVATLPQANSIAVAEIAIFLIFALSKELHLMRRAVEQRQFATPLCGEVFGKTFCIVGLGNVGTALSVRLRALGGEVVAVDTIARTGAAKAFGVTTLYPPNEMLAAIAGRDYVVLCIPLTAATRDLIGEAALAAMGRSARLVNVARGEIVHRGALEKAIFSGALAGYATDVGWEEPLDFSEPLWQRDNVVVSPHVGGMTRETIALNLRLVAENIRLVAQGLTPHFLVSDEEER